MPRTDGALGLNMDVYPHSHAFEMPGMVAPETCWT
jgi:hypothetical protein